MARLVAGAVWTRSRRTGEEVRDLCLEMFQQAGGRICNQQSRGTSGCCCVKKDEAGWRQSWDKVAGPGCARSRKTAMKSATT